MRALQVQSLRQAVLLFVTATALSGCGATSALTYGSEEDAWKQAREQAKLQLDKKDYVAAAHYYEEAVQHATKLESMNPHDSATTRIDQADNLVRLGKFDEAKSAYQAAREVTKRMLSNQENSVLYAKMATYTDLRTTLGLARLYRQAKDYKQAGAEFERGVHLPNAHHLKSYSLYHDLQVEYADMLEESGGDKEKAQQLREEAMENRDGLLQGL